MNTPGGPTACPRPSPSRRAVYRFFHALTTRWHDNDVYGHVNNVVYYSYIDTAVAMYLTSRGLIDVTRPTAVVAETGCRYHRPIAFPDRVTVGLLVAHLGRSSVRYEIGLFRNDEAAAAAEAQFTHVYVDRATMRPTPIPPATRQALAEIAAA